MMPRWTMAVLALLSACGDRMLDDDLIRVRREIKELEGQIPPEAPIWPESFNRAVDDGGTYISDVIYKHIAKHLARMSDEEIRKQTQGAFPFAKASTDADAHRGKFWKIHGTITSLKPEPADLADGKIATVFSGVLFFEDTKPVLVHVMFKPELVWAREDAVEVDGLFVKFIDYQTRSGRVARSPFFMARSMRKFY